MDNNQLTEKVLAALQLHLRSSADRLSLAGADPQLVIDLHAFARHLGRWPDRVVGEGEAPQLFAARLFRDGVRPGGGIGACQA